MQEMDFHVFHDYPAGTMSVSGQHGRMFHDDQFLYIFMFCGSTWLDSGQLLAIPASPTFFSISGCQSLWQDLQYDSVTVVQDVVMELYRYVVVLSS